MTAARAALVRDAPLAHLRYGPAGATRPLAVLLHGIGGGREGWASTGPALAAAGFAVLAVDLPGYGHSAALPEASIDGFAAAVQRLIEATEAAGPGGALVVGHSLGGMVAQALAATAPDRVGALVLAGTSPAFGSSDGAWQQEFLAARLAPLDAGLGMPGLAARLVPAMAGRDATPERLAAAQALMAGVPEATYRAVLPALVRFDRRAALPAIGVPTLVLAGEDDRTAPPAVAERMAARIPHAECRVLPRTGHLLMLENPAAFDAALIDFVQRRVSPTVPMAARATHRTEETVDVRRA